MLARSLRQHLVPSRLRADKHTFRQGDRGSQYRREGRSIAGLRLVQLLGRI